MGHRQRDITPAYVSCYLCYYEPVYNTNVECAEWGRRDLHGTYEPGPCGTRKVLAGQSLLVRREVPAVYRSAASGKAQLGVEAEYIVGLDVSAERNDMYTLLPLLAQMEEGRGIRHEAVVTDAGYESEENYTGLSERGQTAYIKPQNYEKSKKRSFRGNAYLRENMPYDEAEDAYTCPAGKRLAQRGESIRKAKSGFEQTVTHYACADCADCAHKSKCTKAKGNREMEVSKRFVEQRGASLVRITSEYGILLRVNRSIQSEGAFGVLKEDWGLRRFLRRGRGNVMTELLIYAFAYNACKLHAKSARGRLRTQLFQPDSA